MFGLRRDDARDEGRALENAWHIHDAQLDWTAKVDAKAAFALTIQGVLLAAAVALLDAMSGVWSYLLLGLGSLITALGLIVAASVVAPRLRYKHVEGEASSNFIFFGHARRWEPDALARELRRDDLTDQVARQIVVMADIAWKKHRRVGLSIWLAPFGGVFLAAAVVASRL